MTKDELTIFRLQAELHVHQQVIHQLLKAVEVLSGTTQFVPNLKAGLEANAASLAFRNAHPAHSDLLAAEYQEAVQTFFGGM